MEYVNDLHRKNPQDHDPLGKLKEATAIIPDRLTFRWWQLLCAVSVGNIVLWNLAAQGAKDDWSALSRRNLQGSGMERSQNWSRMRIEREKGWTKSFGMSS